MSQSLQKQISPPFMQQPVQVFEHGALHVGQEGFNARHFDALVRYNDRHGCSYFKVGHNRLHFVSFVGVIQVGNLAIEILPKLERDATADKGKWQRALLQMLRLSGLLTVEAAPEAYLRLRRSPLVDIYLDAFLDEVEGICHAGLSKRYRLTEGNLHKLKGRIHFAHQLRKNLIHRERMFTAHQVYDSDNVFNQVLKCAIGIISNLAVRPSIRARASASSLWFEQVTDTRVSSGTFDRLSYDRNTERYRRAIQLARLIILNYSPDLSSGSHHVVAILFDMNRLFERFIYVQLSFAKQRYTSHQLQIEGQVSKRFWSHKTIRPDIVAQFGDAARNRSVILDTKWKIPKDGLPSDEDLKQMYSYNVHLGGYRSVLVYPSSGPDQVGMNEDYAPSSMLAVGQAHACATYYINLFDANLRLRRDIGDELIQKAILFSCR